jgi:hypothetical protein
MKNWELEQFLNRIRPNSLGEDTVHFFSRTTERGRQYWVDRSGQQIIDEAIAYIEKLEAKVEELSYAQKIIDEVNKQNERIHK